MLRFCRWINFCLHCLRLGEFLVFREKVGERFLAESIWDRILSGVTLEAHRLLLSSGEREENWDTRRDLHVGGLLLRFGWGSLFLPAQLQGGIYC